MENYSNHPATRRSASRAFVWLFRIALFLIVGVVTLIALFYAVENWRGSHALKTYKAEWEPKGEKFHWKDILPPEVPDDRNLAMTPLFRPLLDYERVGKKAEWRSSDELAKAFDIIGKGNPPQTFGPESDRSINLRAWQNFFRDKTGLQTSPDAKSPAEDVLLALKEFDPQFKELREAIASRPECRWPVRYEENFAALLPHLAILKNIVRGADLRTAAHLALGHTNEAFADLKIGLRLADTTSADLVLIAHLVRIAMNTVNAEVIRDGLAKHQWNDSQLAFIQNNFSKMNVLAEYKSCMRGERTFSIEAIEMCRTRRMGSELFADLSGKAPPWGNTAAMRLMPSGWYYQNELGIAKFHEQSLAIVDEAAQRVHREDFSKAENALKASFTPYNFFFKALLPAFGKLLPKTARGHTMAQQTAVACALERYRIARRQYPEKLDQLVPQLLEKMPVDVMDGQPLRYRRDGNANYVLYSVGWNQVDDGGKTVGKARQADPMEGDWVWRLPKSNAKGDE